MPNASKSQKIETTPDDWVGVAEASRIINRDQQRVRRLAKMGYVRVHRPPGMISMFYRPDLEKYSPAAALAGTAS